MRNFEFTHDDRDYEGSLGCSVGVGRSDFGTDKFGVAFRNECNDGIERT